MSITELLVLSHLVSTAVLMSVLWLVIGVQSLAGLAARLRHRPARAAHRAAAAAPAVAFTGVDRRQPVHSSG